MGLFDEFGGLSREEFDRLTGAQEEGLQEAAYEPDFILSPGEKARREDFARLIADRLNAEQGEAAKAEQEGDPVQAYIIQKWTERLVYNIASNALGLLLWNRWGRHAFRSRKLRYREVVALRFIVINLTDLVTKVRLNREHGWYRDQAELHEKREAARA